MSVEVDGRVYQIYYNRKGLWYDASIGLDTPDKTLSFDFCGVLTTEAIKVFNSMSGQRIPWWSNIMWYGRQRNYPLYLAPFPPVNCVTCAREILMHVGILIPPWICDPEDILEEIEECLRTSRFRVRPSPVIS